MTRYDRQCADCRAWYALKIPASAHQPPIENWRCLPCAAASPIRETDHIQDDQ